MFSTSAREGGTDTKRQGRTAPHQVAGPASWLPLPKGLTRTQSARNSRLEEAPERVLELGHREDPSAIEAGRSKSGSRI